MTATSLRVGVIATSVAAACQFTHGTYPADGDDTGGTCKRAADECVGDMLRSCKTIGDTPIETPCAWGCFDQTPAHCAVIVPAGSGGVADNAVTATDLRPDDLLDVTINEAVTIDTDNGRIGTLASPNLHHGPQAGIENGIDFQFRGTTSLFRFKSLMINSTVTLVGKRPAVFVADGAVALNATVDARGICSTFVAGPGGFGGGSANSANGGAPMGSTAGGSGAATAASGGGGGGYGTAGGSGNAANGGAAFGDPEISTLLGGAGGGAGDGGGNFGRGGGGGGALQIVSNNSITVATAGGINAGGCGGKAGTGGNDSGGGGGAGGAILLEAPVVSIAGSLAVNGGGGGGGGGGNAKTGANGTLDRTPAAGGSGDGTDEQGGAGAAAATGAANGSNGSAPGGGGGGLGRIRINTRGNTGATLTNATLSPSPTDPATTFSTGRAAVQ